MYLGLLFSTSMKKFKRSLHQLCWDLGEYEVARSLLPCSSHCESSLFRRNLCFASTETKVWLHLVQHFFSVCHGRSRSVLRCPLFDCIHPTPTSVQILSSRLPQAMWQTLWSALLSTWSCKKNSAWWHKKVAGKAKPFLWCASLFCFFIALT